MTKKIYIMVGFILSWPFLFFCLDPGRNPKQYLIDSWGTKEGLPQNSITQIVQTHDGYIWLGTQEGLVRFNAHSFTTLNRKNTHGLKNDYISALMVDKKGILWIGTFGGGLVSYQRGQFKRYDRIEGLASELIRFLYEDKNGTIWIGTNNGLWQYKKHRFTRMTFPGGVQHELVLSVFVDSLDQIWVGTGKGIIHFKEGVASLFPDDTNPPSSPVKAILEDRQGNIWLATDGQGLVCWANKIYRYYGVKDGLNARYIWSLCQDKQGNLWLGTKSEGLYRFSQNRFSLLTAVQGLNDNSIIAIFEDREESLWIGTYNGGLNRLRDGKVITMTTEDGLSHDVLRTVFQSRDGSIWIGTEGGGITRIIGGVVTVYNRKHGLADNVVRAIGEDDLGTIWIGTYGGLSRFDGKRFYSLTSRQGLANDLVRAILTDQRGGLWIGTANGLNYYAGDKFTRYTTDEGLPSNIVHVLLIDRQDNLWIGTEGGGVCIFKKGIFTTFGSKDGIPARVITCFYEDKDGRVWIGTYNNGLYLYQNKKFIHFSSDIGLYNDIVYSIVEDSLANMWMSCNKGIFRVKKKDLLEYAAGKAERLNSEVYNEADGMKNRECNGGNTPSAWKMADGSIWFPTIKGIAIIDFPRMPYNSLPPPVIIERVMVDQKPLISPENIRLLPATKSLEFDYTALCFISSERIEFKYRLEGFDSDWIKANQRRTAYYTNIPPGRYKFRVIACNNDGVWNMTGAQCAIYVKPYVYQTWWFIVIVLIMMAGLIMGIYRWRLKKVEQQRKKLEKTVAERTIELKKINNELKDFAHIVSHDLKAPLRAINQLASWLKEDYSTLFDKKAKEYLDLIINRIKRLNSLIDGILQYSRAGSVKEEMEDVDLNEVIIETVDILIGESKIKFRLENKLPVIKIGRTRMEQVFQNLIGNAVKYMDKDNGEIRVGSGEVGEFWKFWVADNGPGIESQFHERIFQIFQTLHSRDDRESTGVGLTVVKKIVDYYGGTIWVESEPGLGSTFYFTLPKQIKKK